MAIILYCNRNGNAIAEMYKINSLKKGDVSNMHKNNYDLIIHLTFRFKNDIIKTPRHIRYIKIFRKLNFLIMEESIKCLLLNP